MTDAPVLVRTEGAIGRLTLNRPEALHSLNLEMCEIMTGALLKWREDPSIELVVLDHLEGTRGFCAGGDVRALADSVAGDGELATQFFHDEYRLNALIQGYPKPYIALIDGVTMGGGVGISVHGSHRIATENTTFAMPEAGIGLFPDVGGSWFLPRLPIGIGTWMALTGARLKGRDALAAGVATHYLGADQLSEFRAELKNAGVTAFDMCETHAEGSFSPHLGVIETCFTKSSVEEIIDALEVAGDDWAKKQVGIIRRQSPTTLKVAIRQMSEGREHKEFAETMRMEFRIAMRLVRAHDFTEGVRALIIDKDQSPKWQPSHLSEIDDDQIDAIFAPLGDKELQLIGEEVQ